MTWALGGWSVTRKDAKAGLFMVGCGVYCLATLIGLPIVAIVWVDPELTRLLDEVDWGLAERFIRYAFWPVAFGLVLLALGLLTMIIWLMYAALSWIGGRRR